MSIALFDTIWHIMQALVIRDFKAVAGQVGDASLETGAILAVPVTLSADLFVGRQEIGAYSMSDFASDSCEPRPQGGSRIESAAFVSRDCGLGAYRSNLKENGSWR